MSITEEEVKSRYPLHWMVWNNDEQLANHLKANAVTSEELELRDTRGRTPLLLAVTLGHTEAVRALVDAGADVNCDKEGWTVVQEATATGDPSILAQVLSRRDYLRHVVRAGGIPDLLRRLSLAPDFYVEMKWEFTSWVPLVSRMCPFDTYKVYKRGGNVRVDTTLVGFENNHWQRGDRTYIFRGQGRNASLTELDHELGTIWSETLEPATPTQAWPPVTPQALLQRLSAPTALNYLDTEKISFERSKSGIWGWRQDKTENVNGYECKVFSANNVELVSKTRTEHLSRAEKSRLTPRAPLAGLLALADRDSGATTPVTPATPISPEPSNMTADSRDDSPTNRPSTVAGDEEKAPKCTWQEYFSEVPLENDIGKPKEITTKVQKFRATLWLCENYPLELQEQIMPILDLMASMSSPHFAKLKDFVQMQLPAGFPVKIEIPLFHVLNARITFGNIFGTETPVPHVECIREGERLACVVDDACFSIAKGYRITVSPVDDLELLKEQALQARSAMAGGARVLRFAVPGLEARPRAAPERTQHRSRRRRARRDRPAAANVTAAGTDTKPAPALDWPVQSDALNLDERLACSMEHDESLLQYAIQQSLMDPGTHDDQVDVWEALRGARPASPSPQSCDSPEELLSHEERQLQRAIEASLAALALGPDAAPAPAPCVDQALQDALQASAHDQAQARAAQERERRELEEALRRSLLEH